MTEEILTKCPQCKTRTLHREGEELVCSECKGHFPAPTEGHVSLKKRGRKRKTKLIPSPQRPASRHAYLEAHKQEIIKDLLTYGRTPTRKKWTIPAGTLHSLERRWLTPDEKAKLDTITFGIGSTLIFSGKLPPFPKFSDSWDPQVQLKWLDIYERERVG
jgi:hypothetical protein